MATKQERFQMLIQDKQPHKKRRYTKNIRKRSVPKDWIPPLPRPKKTNTLNKPLDNTFSLFTYDILDFHLHF